MYEIQESGNIYEYADTNILIATTSLINISQVPLREWENLQR